MADLDEIFRTLQQQQDYLAEVGKKIENDIERDKEKQLATQREREREELKKKAEIEARNEALRKQREAALKESLETQRCPTPEAQQAPKVSIAPPPTPEDSSTAGPLRLPSGTGGIYESLRQSRRGRDVNDGPSITDLLEISDPQITAEEAWDLLPPTNLPPPPPPPLYMDALPPHDEQEDDEAPNSAGKPSMRHSYSAVSPRGASHANLKTSGSHFIISPASDTDVHVTPPESAPRTTRSASEMMKERIALTTPDEHLRALATRPRGAAISGSDGTTSNGSAPPRVLALTPTPSPPPSSSSASHSSSQSPSRGHARQPSGGGLFSLFGRKKSADPSLEATLDHWPRRLTKPSKTWPMAGTEKDLIEHFVELCNDFVFELTGSLNLESAGALPFDDEPELVPHYETVFYGKEHTNYIALDPDLGPVVVSAEHVANRRLRCIIRTKAGEERALVPGLARKRKELEKQFPQFAKLNFLVLQSTACPKVCTDLLAYERHLVVHNFKFGVLYWKTGQSLEDEFYANGDADLSPAFKHFLTLIGDKVPLINWSRFKGGLRTTDSSTGTHSIYTDFVGFEVMYHIAPMIPNPSIDKQQLDRKRHLGNDIVVILFRDHDNAAPFNPHIMRSQVNQIFILVQAIAPQRYRVGVMAKLGIPTFGPQLPPDGIVNEANLRAFLLTKMINGERAAMQGPDFAMKLINSRQKLLTHMYNNHKDQGKP